jgi:DNA-binding transcriptional MerR regulator
MKQTEGFSIGAPSGRSGVHIETIRYYEKIGIGKRSGRS